MYHLLAEMNWPEAAVSIVGLILLAVCFTGFSFSYALGNAEDNEEGEEESDDPIYDANIRLKREVARLQLSKQKTHAFLDKLLIDPCNEAEGCRAEARAKLLIADIERIYGLLKCVHRIAEIDPIYKTSNLRFQVTSTLERLSRVESWEI